MKHELTYTVVSIAVLLIGVVRGYRRGFTGLAPSVLALACGAVVANVAGEGAAAAMQGWLPVGEEDTFRPFMASFLPAAAVYCIAYTVVEVITGILRRILGVIGFGILNALSGAIFCSFNYLVWLSMLFNLIICLDHDSTLIRTLSHDDGNIVGVVLVVAPAVVGAESPAELNHAIQVRDARKISSADVINKEKLNQRDAGVAVCDATLLPEPV